MDVKAYLERIRRADWYEGQISHVEVLPAREGQFVGLSRPLPDALVRVLKSRSVEQLYSHQTQAVEAARAGQDFVVVTGTASGKTLCYDLPILESCLEHPQTRALLLYPTKALTQDQLRRLLDLLSLDLELKAQIRPGVFDGDTPTAQRRRIKAEANLVLSNPDMLHASILPYHPKWARFFAELKYVVLDEVHMYRGILGANVACVLRRLRRVCRHYGSEPLFLAASATIANPGDLTARLVGRPLTVIDQDGSPRGRKYFVLWNPAPLGQDDLARRSSTDDAVQLLVEAIEDDAQALAFTRTRQTAELTHRYVQDALRERRSPRADAVRAYRGGYLPHERRDIEADLFAGRLRGVAATNALELGVDIGSLDVTILVNYPGTIASTWQQAGRSGRRCADSLSVLVAGNDPIDQYLIRHPAYFFGQSPEQAVVDPQNPYVLANHLKAAAFELPLDSTSAQAFGPLATSVADILHDAKELARIDGKYYSTTGTNPAQRVSLRHMSDETFSVVLVKSQSSWGRPDRLPRVAQLARERRAPISLGGPSRSDLAQEFEVIANVDAISAPELIYPQAVYLHNAESYFVRELDLDGKVAYVERHEMNYYTQAILESQVRIQKIHDHSCTLPAASLAYGEVDVEWKTVAFKKIKFTTRENIGYGSVDIPSQHLPTTAFWLTPADSVREAMKADGLPVSEGLSGLRNLAIVSLPFVAMCDSRDISGVVDSTNLGQSSLILYDRYPGGLGYAEKGFQEIEPLLRICAEMVERCPCEDGCPSCVGLPNLRPAIHSDPDLARGYPIPDKRAAKMLLELLVHAADILPSKAERPRTNLAACLSRRSVSPRLTLR